MRRSPDALCRLVYRRIDRELRCKGFEAGKIEESRTELSRRDGVACWLDVRAYEPTGVALGCPLPDPRVTRRLRRLARLFAQRLAEAVGTAEPVFAFVPPERYHVTLVNRTHFDVTALDRMTGTAHLLSGEEREVARAALREFGRVAMQLHGFILSASGRLLACGYPCDDRLYDLRARIVSALPTTQENLPPHACVKLGHVLVAPAGEALARLLGELPRLGERASGRLVFGDAYTPAGRIALQGETLQGEALQGEDG